jgi:uncharacterized membrane protein
MKKNYFIFGIVFIVLAVFALLDATYLKAIPRFLFYNVFLTGNIDGLMLVLGIIMILLGMITLLVKVYRKQNNLHTLLIFLVGFVIVFTSLAFYRHINLGTSLFDFGLEQQVIWNTANGRFFQSGVEVSNYLGDHFSLITLPVALIYKFLPSVVTLFLLQTLAVAAAALGVFYLASKHLSKKISLVLSITFSLSLAASGLMLFEYHPVVFALPLIIWGIYFYEQKHTVLSLGLMILAAVCKEDSGIYLFAFGISLILKKKKIGLVYAIIGLAISTYALLYLIPSLRGSPSDTLDRFAYLGNSPGQILLSIFTNPLLVLKHLLVKQKLTYLLKLLLPNLFTALLSPLTAIAFIPNLLINLLSDNYFQNSALYQYDVMTLAGITYASIYGVKNLQTKFKKYYQPKYFWILFAVINSLFFFAHPFWSVLLNTDNRIDDYQYLTNLKQVIPISTTVAVTNSVGGQFGEFEKVQLFYPFWLSYTVKPDLIIIDKKFDLKNQVGNELAQKISSLLQSGEYTKLLENDNLLVLKNSQAILPDEEIIRVHY